jgi:hypothetical protein
MPDGDELRLQLGRLLSEHEDEVNELLASAREEAMARVRSLLVQAYTDVLLQRARDALASSPARRSHTPAAAPDHTRAPAAPDHTRAPAAPDSIRAHATPNHTRAHATPNHTRARATPNHTQAPAAPDPVEARALATDHLGWYVYCVIGDDHAAVPDDLAGIDPYHEVVAVRQGELTAIVSHVPLAEFGEQPLREHLSDLEWVERTARRHEHVLDEIARGGTPIPMRLCSIYRDEAGVREMLKRETHALRHALTHLRGKAEWGVKAFADVDAAEPRAPAEPSTLGSGDGAAYMHARLTQRLWREDARARLTGACQTMHAALCAVAAQGVTSAPQRPEVSGQEVPMIFNASYLVAGADAEAFHRELACLGDELAPLGVTIQKTGPWPPYNFVPGTIGAGW